MAIQKEIWERSIVEHLFADNSFMSKAFNANEFVNQGKIVHIPQAGAASKVAKDRTALPAEVKKRKDSDLTYTLGEFTTDPILIPHADTVELSYDKRESVLRQDKMVLFDEVAKDFIYNWSPATSHTISTSGEAQNDGLPHSTATGARKALTRQDVANLMLRFNRDNIPQEGRYLLLDAVMYSQLLNDLTSADAQAFHALADAKNGILGKFASFNIMMRSEAALYTSSGPKSWSTTAAADDLGAALAWHEQSVVRALGEVKAYEKNGDPTYYGDIYSFLVRAGGRIRRSDNKGVWAIVQATAQ